MLQTEIQSLSMKASGAFAFGVYSLLYTYFGGFSAVAIGSKGLGPIVSSALLERRAVLPANFIEISQAVSPPGRVEDFADKRKAELLRIRLLCQRAPHGVISELSCYLNTNLVDCQLA